MQAIPCTGIHGAKRHLQRGLEGSLAQRLPIGEAARPKPGELSCHLHFSQSSAAISQQQRANDITWRGVSTHGKSQVDAF